MKFEKIQNIPWRQIDSCVVVLNPKTGKVHELDEVASFLWMMADGKTPLNETVQRLCDEFDVDPAMAETDALEFYRELESFRLLQVHA